MVPVTTVESMPFPRSAVRAEGCTHPPEYPLKKIFILQLVGLVLTYNFTDCDFKKIKESYRNIIYQELNNYTKGTKAIDFDHFVYCEDQPDCLSKIQSLTFEGRPGCAAPAREAFAVRTHAALAAACPGYRGPQINNTQTMRKIRKRQIKRKECLEQVTYLKELWQRLSRIS
ncbi:thymic stromal lymphopoietin [Bos indicus x Bos taurus]|uniref:thymic stromal lymphopoietin n=1 Tax=Bos indicus x Bos taurus TaxID=30522 RepID=UPI000F7D57F3|nr:thymic stromal lymphopoietin [Bos indicus x Bos taurus]